MSEQFTGIQSTIAWFKAFVPNPNTNNASVQIGCDLEEAAELFGALGDRATRQQLDDIANVYKSCNNECLELLNKSHTSEKRVEILDAIVDKIVTAVGIGHMLGMDVLGALSEVNRSNWSKADENGNPIFLPSGKIGKSESYTKPNLEPYV